MQKSRCLILLSVIFSFPAFADYCATGKFEGQVCSGFIIESCKFVKIDAVKDDEGNLHNVKRCFRDVTEYNGGKGRCWINTKSRGAGLVSMAANAIAQPSFLHKNRQGGFEEVDIEYLTFSCKKY